MGVQLISFQSTDKLELPGLLFSPNVPTNKVAIWLHGMGDNASFYNTSRANALGKALNEQNIAFLLFNNRGGHEQKKLNIADEALPKEKRTYQGGSFFEKIADCVLDIEGAAIFLKSRDFTELYIIGHSTGANKICVYDKVQKINPFSKYVFAGPGDDSGLFYEELGDKKFWNALKIAKEKIAAGKSLATMPKSSGMNPFSAQSAADILDPDGDYNTFPFFESTTRRLGKKKLFKEYRQIEKPVQVIIGEFDEYAYTAGGAKNALSLLERNTVKSILKKSDFSLVKGADHSFHGYEREFAGKVASWLAE